MKIILIHAESIARKIVKKQIDALDHLVVAEPLDSGKLLADVARHQPHAILAGALPTAFENGEYPPLGDNVATVPVVRLPDHGTDEAQIAFLKEALETVWIRHQSLGVRPYCSDGQRLVLHDDRYKSFAQAEKLGSELPSDPEAEKEIFVSQVDCARTNQEAARRYMDQLVETDYGLRTELCYRIVHASYKSLSWARDHALRYASVLCHYVHGVQVEYLPPPVSSPSGYLDYVHYEATPESLYAAAALIGHGFKPSMVPGFRAILVKKFTGQPPEALHAEAIALWGWCSILREVALAQIQLMDQILDSDSRWYSGEMPKRTIHRTEGIFGDFWCLPSLRRNPGRMRELARMVLLEGLGPLTRVSVVAPYRAFFEAHQAGHSTSAERKEGL